MCTANCTHNTYGNPVTGTCVNSVNCPDNYYGYTLIQACIPIADCPSNYFKDASQKLCTIRCL